MSSLETFTLPTKGTFETKQNQQQLLNRCILLNFSDPPEGRKKKSLMEFMTSFLLKENLNILLFLTLLCVCFNFYSYQSKHEHGSEDSIRIVQKDL